LGELKWKGGKEEFKGEWHNDKRVKGYMKLLDGTEYDGEFSND
jgi:hypothetical protein